MGQSLSYWEKKHYFNYDVLVAGAGIVGLNAALTLKERSPALKIAVLERGFIPSGASTKNAGFACFGSVSELIEQERSAGTDGLHELITKRWRGLQKLRGLLGDKNIDFQCLGGYELFRLSENSLSAACVDKLGHFNALVADIVNEKEVFSVANQKIDPFGFKEINVLLENKLEAQIDPGQMMLALQLRATAAGVVIYNNCTVRSFEEDAASQRVLTDQGNFTCRKLLVCTNAFVNTLLPELGVVPGRGQVIVTSPIKDLKIKGTFHYQKGYYYFRNIDGRLLLGGGRNLDFETETTADFGSTPLVQHTLEDLLHEVILPGTVFEIEHRWSGIMAFGDSISPIVSEVRPSVFCAARCSGMGIAIGSQTGEDAGLMVLKQL